MILVMDNPFIITENRKLTHFSFIIMKVFYFQKLCHYTHQADQNRMVISNNIIISYGSCLYPLDGEDVVSLIDM